MVNCKEVDDELSLSFRYTFEHTNELTFFAFNYPFSFEEMQNMIGRLALYCQLPSVARYSPW
jgi:hypothetical protein